MRHSNLSSPKSLREANFIMMALTGCALLILFAALLITQQGFLPAFNGTAWFSDTILYSNFFFSAVASAIFIYGSIYCWQREQGWQFLLAGIVAAMILLCAQALQLLPTFGLINSASLLVWLFCLGSLLWRISKIHEERASNLNLLLTLILPILYILIANFLLAMTFILHPRTQDELLLAVDATLGFNPSFAAGQFFLMLPAVLFSLFRIIYLMLPCALAVIYVARYFQQQKPPLEFVIEFFLLGIGGLMLFNITTGCGPINAFKPHWPQLVPIIPLHPQLQVCMGRFLPRNCLPSLHTAWAICVWRHSLHCHPKIRLLMAVWALITLASTLGLGEHYLVDLMVGFAFASFMGGVCAISVPLRLPARKHAIVLGGLLCVTWYLLINFGLALLRLSPLVPWCCYLLSFALCVWLEFNLSRAQKLIDA